MEKTVTIDVVTTIILMLDDSIKIEDVVNEFDYGFVNNTPGVEIFHQEITGYEEV